MTEPIVQESYIVNEGKKRGSTRDVRPEAAHDGFTRSSACTPATRFSSTTGIPTKSFSPCEGNFEGYTFAMRTLEAWGAMIEIDRRAYYTAGGRIWVLDIEPAAGKKPRIPQEA